MHPTINLTVALLLSSLAVISIAATPDQVGSYTGTIKSKTIGVDDSKGSTKQEMHIQIAADDATTVTIAGIVQSTQESGYYASGGSVIFTNGSLQPATLFSLSLHFKSGALTGVGDGGTLLANPQTLVSTSQVTCSLKHD